MIQSSSHDQLSVLETFKKGGIDIKLSFVIMGFANLMNKQFIKGFLFLLSEIAFLIAFVTQVIPAFSGLLTLGTKTQGMQEKIVDGVKLQVAVEGDNSMLMLIFGLASLIFCLVFAYIYWCNLKSARNLYMLKKEGRHIPSFKEDFMTLANGRFHMTLMFIPLIGVLLFTILPLVYMICLAFTNYDHNHLPPKSLFDWVGLANFGNVLNGRMAGTFFPVLSWTLIWAVFATVTNFLFGVILALIINAKGLKLKKMWRTIFVITIASAVASLIYSLVLVPFNLEYLQTIVFILVIAGLVQFVEMFLKKSSPALYNALGVYLPLITTNCAVLGVALTNVQKEYDFVTSVVNGIGTSVGFTIAIVIMAGIRERNADNTIIRPLQGMPIVLFTAALMAIAFNGFAGLI